MNSLNQLLAVFILANLSIALVRVIRGPTTADRLLAALLFGTSGVAILLLLAYIEETLILLDVALVFSLLAVISGVVFTQRAWRTKEEKK
ncbi:MULTISPECIES: monovalent cation/H+ antiporter complex subunit F [Nitrosomonas]|uniref:Multicomponent Na+:H+ antiporter subunit F n=1 Tax=Nitrosomonas communis TaxID=44574 RepID=A0A0F7KDB7_9PROT|nr:MULTISPECIES: monovalent cation/H+ antiporter complex subunit F [Nitrosomonas]AKH36732.1 pH regulation protein F [Nitrosomonas communis]TYP73010.1 multicomponent Na+:H+ antiporter subunit F [Nitrosomonas communis]UVS61806.1 monovalent cation/H+ antiporter complex subunit F [Nitrosomonas sp. PLL12]